MELPRLNEQVLAAQGKSPHGSHVIEEEDGTCSYQGRIWVPPSVVPAVLQAHHNAPSVGHPGIQKTKELIVRSYDWWGLDADVWAYVQHCWECQ